MPEHDYQLLGKLEYCHEFNIFHRPFDWVTSSLHVLMLLTTGRGEVNWKADQEHPQPADASAYYLFYLPPDSWRFVDVFGTGPMHIVAVRFSLNYEDGADISEYYAFSAAGLRKRQVSMRRLILSMMAAARTADTLGKLECERQFRILLGYFLNTATPRKAAEFHSRPVRCRRAIAYLQNHYAEPLDIAGLAELCRVSRPYFFALFRQETGMTAQQYLCRIRIEHARKLLLFSPRNVEEIGQEVGWNDPFHFSRIFTRETGLSPAKFRHLQVT